MKHNKKTLSKAKYVVSIGAALVLIFIFIIPALGLAGSSKFYVDDDTTGKQDGTSEHPYKNLREALKKAKAGDEIHVRAGVYKGNIEIPKGVKVFGEDRERVIIEADDNSYEVVDMNHKTELNKVTVKGGNYGIRIGKNDRASVINCVVKNSRKHGILIETSEVSDKYKASITDSLITKNGKKGIYSAQRRLVLINNQIISNGNDGLEIEANSRVWLKKNKFKDNDGSGLKVTLDGAYVWTDKNSFSDNKREGIEINAYGKKGTIDLKDSKITGNGRWGLAKIERNYFSSVLWNGVVLHNDVKIYANKDGSISPPIKIIGKQ